MKASKMAELFDVAVGDNLSTDDNDEVITPQNLTATVDFAQKVEDVQMLLSPEEINSDTELIKKAISGDAKKNTTVTKPTSLAVDEVIDTVPVEVGEIGTIDVQVKTEVNEVNPLGLDPDDLRAYQELQVKCPQFTLYDGNIAYRSFYKWKVINLKNLLTSFPLLDLPSMTEELHGTQIKHFIGDDVISPELVQRKLDDTYRCRTRVASLLIAAFEQFYAWERILDMLKGKLFKDHEIRGADKRDGMVLEHVSDIELYVSKMKGFIESAKHFDSMLKAAADSLSRQLTCMQIKEHLVGQRIENKMPIPMVEHDLNVDGLDVLESGTVVSSTPQNPTNAAMTVHYGVDDEISVLG